MSNYAAGAKPPRVLPDRETAALLKVSGEHVRGFRDHIIFSLACGSGLREFEICALNIGDVSEDGRNVRPRFFLRVFKGHRREGSAARQQVFLSDDTRRKLERYLAGVRQQPLFLAEEPLFFSRGGKRRLSTRRVREVFALWAARAGIDTRRYSFHSLRHRYCSTVYRESRDIVQLMRLARHSRVETSMIYTHPTEEELAVTARKVRS